MNTETPSNTFHAMLQHQRKGKLLAELSEQLQQVTLAAREFGEPATLTLTIRVSPANGDASAMAVADEIKTKLPQPKKPTSLFFVTDEGALVRNNPNQSEMNLTAVASNPDRSPVEVQTDAQTA